MQKTPRLQQHYQEHVRPRMTELFGYTNPHQVPAIEKVKINVGVGDASKNQKLLESVVEELGLITGQRAVITWARKSISNFSLREGMPVGASVTLRRRNMFEFLDRLVSVAVPRIRDFRGLSPKQFDGHGNYTFGLNEQSVFHEIDQDKIDRTRGMDITVVTTATNDDEGRALLRLLGFPFKEA